MPTLSLLRHAKSSWSDPALGDFDRPLAPRGRKAAPRMGRYMAENDLAPNLVLCSTAARARETLKLVLAEIDAEPKVRFVEQLYHAGPETLLEAICDTADEIGHLMLVGHNPGFHGLALMLVGTGSPKALDQLVAKFPTAGLAVFALNDSWRESRFGTAELRAFVVPRALSGKTGDSI